MKHNLQEKLFSFSASFLIQRMELKRMGIKKLLLETKDVYLLEDLEAVLKEHLRLSTKNKESSLAYLQTTQALENLDNYKSFFSTPELKHLHVKNCFISHLGEFPILINFIRDKIDKRIGRVEGYILLPRSHILFKEKDDEP